ncbi:MAG: BLUF domain-containing protein [Rhizobiaceae bacterium]
MKFIVYVSQAEQPFASKELSDLLEHSRARNTKDEISGLLIYRFNPDFGRGNFLQILEGPETALEDVWKRIANDNRHHTIIVLEEGDIDARMFGDWSMGFKNVDEADLQDFEGFSNLGSDAFWEQIGPQSAPDAMELLRSFYDGG